MFLRFCMVVLVCPWPHLGPSRSKVLGYKAIINEARGVQNLDAVLSLTGCKDLECQQMDVTVSHVALESWLGAYGSDYEAFKETWLQP